MSVAASAAASVSVTVAPLTEGEPERLTVPSLPPCGVRFTVNAPLARPDAAARSSPKVSTSEVPSTDAEDRVGAVLSTA